jgi:hypothetical protein
MGDRSQNPGARGPVVSGLLSVVETVEGSKRKVRGLDVSSNLKVSNESREAG